jgi:hypothetical protein
MKEITGLPDKKEKKNSAMSFFNIKQKRIWRREGEHTVTTDGV